LRNVQAFEFSEKSELENLFLDCVEECKKDTAKRAQNQQMYGADNWNAQLLHSQQPTVDNMSLATRVLLEQVCTNKESLVMVFQELFGP